MASATMHVAAVPSLSFHSQIKRLLPLFGFGGTFFARDQKFHDSTNNKLIYETSIHYNEQKRVYKVIK